MARRAEEAQDHERLGADDAPTRREGADTDAAYVQAMKIAAGVQGFAAEMRDKGIHVGINGVCATCGEPWECAASVSASDGNR